VHESRFQFQAGLFTTQLTLRQPDIVAPYDFGFQLRHYVIAPELREAQKLVEVVRLATGQLVKVDVESDGTADAPLIDVLISSPQRLSPVNLDEVRARLVWHLSLDADLRPFYAIAAGDPVLSASIAHSFGAKGKRTHSLFDGLVDVILFQNVTFRRAYAMRASLNARFGDSIVAGGRVYYASPTPAQLAAAPLEALRAAKVGYRDSYIKGVAAAVVGGVDVEALKHRPGEEARHELMRLPGVGPYTADLTLIRGGRHPHALFLDVYIRQVIRQLYFGGARVPDERIRAFARSRWGGYQGLAALYLTTDTHTWAQTLGVDLGVRSAALSDPDAS
jgi:3-methyladenine DNA glycosylase/8-oxoguanine DNA glycosylase